MHHGTHLQPGQSAAQPLVLIGNPNVGKSVLFGLLTGRYVTVSNYPGTTVEVATGHAAFAPRDRLVFDAPGVNSLVPQSEDERVARDVLLDYPGATVVQVADAKNLARALFITAQLAEMRLPSVLVLNMWDEATERGIAIDTDGLTQELGIPVIRMVATERRGLRALLGAIAHARVPNLPTRYPDIIESALAELEPLVPELPIAPRAAAVMLLANDQSLADRIRRLKPKTMEAIEAICRRTAAEFARPVSYLVAEWRNRTVNDLATEYSYRESARLRSSPWAQAVALGLVFPVVAFLIGYKLADLLSGVPGWFWEYPAWWSHVFRLAGGGAGFALLSYWLARLLGPSELRRALWWRAVGVPLVGFAVVAVPVQLVASGAPGSALAVGAGLGGMFGLSLWVRWREFHEARRVRDAVGWLCLRPSSAIPILLVVLWLIYYVVGVIGAGQVVDFFESKIFASAWEPSDGIDVNLFGRFITHVPFRGVNYYLGDLLGRILPAEGLFSQRGLFYELLFAQDDGLVEVGVRYSVAIVLPIVTFFFFMFGVFEDSGYLPRLAAMSNRVLKRIGLTGKAALPMVLGLGCDTMATLTARILDTPKQRLIVTVLLALAIPCSAQLGVISGMLASIGGSAFAVYAVVILAQLFIVGSLASLLIRGEPGDFVIDVPPFRVPKVSNIAKKTFFRIGWFMKEAVPLFLIGTLAVFILRKVGLLEMLQAAASPVVSGLLSLPEESTKGFILGFLRRDYGAIVIFEQFHQGHATIRQALVAMVVITLFVPCIANFFVIIKEQGTRRALLILAFIIPYAMLIGAILNVVLGWLGAFSGSAISGTP